MTTPVGFVGLGNMGLPMAQNVLKAGYALHIFNRTAAKAEGLLAQGATWAPSPQVLAARTGLVLSMVTDDDALHAVALGEHGILAGLPPQGVHIDMSTVFPDTSQRLADIYRERGAYFIAAPVSGRPEHAAAAQLLIYAAGPAVVLAQCRPLLHTLGQGVIVVGEAPHLANVLKLVTNLIVFALDETLSEVFTLADKAGLKSEPVLEMIRVLFPSSIIQLYARRIATSDFYSPGASVRMGLKDLGHMRKLAEQVAAPLPVAELASRHLLAALARGRGDLDVAALVTVVRELAGLAPGTR
jgi:3-hydroxyisobutyrate dehydrogenase-like beta-hydroxyacid dehydrogenase